MHLEIKFWKQKKEALYIELSFVVDANFDAKIF